MKERLGKLNGFQKFMLLLIVLMTVGFTIRYAVVTSQNGYVYCDTILMPSEENGNVVWSGNIQGKRAVFTVSPDKTVEFRHGDKLYGPYSVKEDPSAVPKNHEMSEALTGMEVRCKDEILFRGGVWTSADGYRMLYSEDGSPFGTDAWQITVNGIAVDENGDQIDPVKPSVYTVLALTEGPKLEHYGSWSAWSGGMLLCIFTLISILFADELFRWQLRRTIRNSEGAEPSDWVIMSRYLGWIILPAMALIIFIIGLKE